MLSALATKFLAGSLTKVREDARASVCHGHLTEIAVALHAYAGQYGHLPASSAGADGRPPVSWRVKLLESHHPELWRDYHFEEAWDGPHNRTLAGRMPRCYRCESADVPPHCTTYYAVVGPNTAFPDHGTTRFSDFQRPLGDVLVVIEDQRRARHWMEPWDISYADFVAGGLPPPLHRQGVSALMANGHKRWLTPADRPALATLPLIR